jgi:hypothetical protein
MRLIELEPRWKGYGGNPRAAFLFRCPHCRTTWLSCTLVPMKISEQLSLFVQEEQSSGGDVILSKQLYAWAMTGDDFGDLSITPSIDASASGHWHGFITRGECK